MARVNDLYARLDLPPAIREAIELPRGLGDGVGGFDPAVLLPILRDAGSPGAVFAFVIIPVWVFYLIKDRLRWPWAPSRHPARVARGHRCGLCPRRRVFSPWLGASSSSASPWAWRRSSVSCS